MNMTRRGVLGLALVTALPDIAFAARAKEESEWTVGIIPDQPFNIDLINLRKIPPAFHRQEVVFREAIPTGTIVVDTGQRFIYWVQGGGRAIRYGIAVGRDNASWKGDAVVGRKAKWPTWTPTANMRRRNSKLPARVKGGPDNPLGARALYLYRNGRDTIYRIHGTNEPWSIGKAASSGCFRMLNEHVFELFGSVVIGTRVIVR